MPKIKANWIELSECLDLNFAKVGVSKHKLTRPFSGDHS